LTIHFDKNPRDLAPGVHPVYPAAGKGALLKKQQLATPGRIPASEYDPRNSKIFGLLLRPTAFISRIRASKLL